MPSIDLVHVNALGRLDAYQCAWLCEWSNEGAEVVRVILFHANAAGAFVGVQEMAGADVAPLRSVPRKPKVDP